MYFEQGNIDRYQAMIKVLDERFKANQARNLDLEQEIAAKETSVSQANDLVVVAKSMQSRLDNEIKTLDNHKISLVNEIKNLGNKKSMLIGEIAEYEAIKTQSGNEMASVLSELHKYEIRVKMAKESLQKVQSEIDVCIKERDEAKREKAKADKEIASIKALSDKVQAERLQLQEEIKEYKQQVENLTDWERLLVRTTNEINKHLDQDNKIKLWQEQV